MRKINSILAVLSALMMYSCSSAPTVGDGEFVIHGKLTNVPDSVQLRLLAFEGDLMKTVAIDTVIGGEFMFRDTITSGVRRLYLMSDSDGFPGAGVDIWVTPNALIEITGEDKLVRTWSIESDVQEQKEDNNFADVTFPEMKELMELSVEDSDLWRLYSNSKRDRDENYRIKRDSIRELEKPLRDTITKKELEYLKTAPISSHWMRYYLVFAKFSQYDHIYDKPIKIKIKELYTRMSDSDKQTEAGQQITAYLNPPQKVNVGDDMVDGDLYDLDGKLQHLSQFKGKYILLDFWSQGCGPCIQSIPEMEELAEVYKDNLVVIGISLDTKKVWKEYVSEEKMKGLQWNELKSVPILTSTYGVVGIPYYVLISPEAKVQSMWSGYGTGSLKAKLKQEIK